MSEQVMSALVGGISGTISSGAIYWLLDKRRERKRTKQYTQARKDVIAFFKAAGSIQRW
jgi:nitrate reductase gamma subunit